MHLPVHLNSKIILRSRAPTCVSIVGAGGKTSVMLALAEDYAEQGCTVAISTTTKIWPPANLPLVLDGDNEVALQWIDRALVESGRVVIGEKIGPEGKLYGLRCATICRLRDEVGADLLLVEADGAASRSIKAHGPGEPVVPPCSDTVLVLAGMDAVGAAVGPAVVHRLEHFRALTGARSGEILSAEHAARALLAAGRYAPKGARVVYVLNKAGDDHGRRAARAVTARLDARQAGTAVIWSAWGRPLEPDGKAVRWA